MEQRQQRRQKTGAPAIMRIETRPGGFLVTVLDFSTTGLRVNSSIPVDAGTRVAITCRGFTAQGEVRYTRAVETGDDFHIGIAVDGGSDELFTKEGDLDVALMFRKPSL